MFAEVAAIEAMLTAEWWRRRRRRSEHGGKVGGEGGGEIQSVEARTAVKGLSVDMGEDGCSEATLAVEWQRHCRGGGHGGRSAERYHNVRVGRQGIMGGGGGGGAEGEVVS